MISLPITYFLEMLVVSIILLMAAKVRNSFLIWEKLRLTRFLNSFGSIL
jgi:hypothetical protein